MIKMKRNKLKFLAAFAGLAGITAVTSIAVVACGESLSAEQDTLAKVIGTSKAKITWAKKDGKDEGVVKATATTDQLNTLITTVNSLAMTGLTNATPASAANAIAVRNAVNTASAGLLTATDADINAVKLTELWQGDATGKNPAKLTGGTFTAAQYPVIFVFQTGDTRLLVQLDSTTTAPVDSAETKALKALFATIPTNLTLVSGNWTYSVEIPAAKITAFMGSGGTSGLDAIATNDGAAVTSLLGAINTALTTPVFVASPVVTNILLTSWTQSGSIVANTASFATLSSTTPITALITSGTGTTAVTLTITITAGA